MPSVEEFNRIEPYKTLLDLLGGPEMVTYGNQEQSKSSINRGVRYLRIGGNYDSKVSPEENGRVGFYYGAYKIYQNRPFSTKEEREKTMELFVLYSIGKMLGYNINQGIFKPISEYLLGNTDKLNIKHQLMEEFAGYLISQSEKFDNYYGMSEKGYILYSYLLSKYGGEIGKVSIAIAASNIKSSGGKKEILDRLIPTMMGLTNIDSLCDYIKKNPLQIYILDELPDLKQEVLKRTGMRDYSSIGRKLKKGMI